MTAPPKGRTAWIDARSGVSGDMLLGALCDLGALDIAAFATTLGVDVDVSAAPGTRGGLRGIAVSVRPGADQPHRQLPDLLGLVDRVTVDPAVRDRSVAVFRRLAAAEGRVHGVSPESVEFHELGAVDTIVDVVGAAAGFAALGLDRLVVSPIALGGGQAQTAHGVVPVPGPAVLELLAASNLVGFGGPVEVELATPTGVAILAELADGNTGAMPAMEVTATGIGLGGRDLAEQPNVLRLVIGRAVAAAAADDDWLLLEANVDDLDPRLWPGVLTRLLDTGAGDAWLTPIVMKKGRAAHTISVLVAPDRAEVAAQVLFTESSTIGVRTTRVGKRTLDREWMTVRVAGHDIRIKVARLAGRIVNAVPEYDDVSAAAAALGRPVKAVLAAAAAAAAHLLDDDAGEG
jgi:pyridinium-3,5-bisthiocarboxylic acid mononucleotide nickel chelatase